MSSHRQLRVEELLKSYIASKLLLEDAPRDLLITVTAVKVTRDLKYATVYWCQSGTESKEVADPECEACLKALVFDIRKGIASDLGLRHVPSISFVFDTTPFMSDRIEVLLKS